MTLGLRRFIAAAFLIALPLGAQDSTHTTPPRVPFGIGERMEYQVKFGKLPVGSGEMEVLPMDTVRGHEVWHTVFKLRGGIPFYRVNDKYEVWFDSHSLASLRYWQDIDEGSYEPKRHFEIFPRPPRIHRGTKEPQESVEHPLDEASFLYFLRTIPLRIGMDTSFNNYFKAKANPVRIKVLRTDTISVPAGTFAAIVIQPIFESKLFSEGGHAEIWLSDDENHIMLQMKSKVSFGSLSLYLKSYQPSPTTSIPVNRVSKPENL